MTKFTHLNKAGHVHMVDVSTKDVTVRTATATGFVHCSEMVLNALADQTVPKGDVFALARIAGIAGAKKTAELLPLAHVISVHGAEIDLEHTETGIKVTATVRAAERTGVEMEALVAVSTACLAIVDMVKGLDKTTWISDIKIMSKTGGKSGEWIREGHESEEI